MASTGNLAGSFSSEPDPRFRLDPSRFPQRLDIEIPDELYEQLLEAAQQTNRTVPELVHSLICQMLDERAKESGG